MCIDIVIDHASETIRCLCSSRKYASASTLVEFQITLSSNSDANVIYLPYCRVTQHNVIVLLYCMTIECSL